MFDESRKIYFRVKEEYMLLLYLHYLFHRPTSLVYQSIYSVGFLYREWILNFYNGYPIIHQSYHMLAADDVGVVGLDVIQDVAVMIVVILLSFLPLSAVAAADVAVDYVGRLRIY